MEITVAVAAPTPSLPDDVLEAILGRLLACSLAVSRQVCRAWRDIVDRRRLLLPFRHLLPNSVRGIFVNYVDHRWAHFFARPSAAGGPGIDGEFSFIESKQDPSWHKRVADHCNGLVLYWDDHRNQIYVCNPATRRWVRLPPLAGPSMWRHRAFLVFSPAVSRHYEVLVFTHAFYAPRPAENRAAEWPPSQWTWHVLSSRTGRWRERVFVREGEAAGTLADMLAVMKSLSYFTKCPWRYAAYWRGALYVHCEGEYVSRLSLSDGKYRVITSPIDRSTEWYNNNNVRTFIGRSKEGVHFAAIRKCHLRVWILNECHERTEWLLKHDRVLQPNDWWNVVDDYGQIQREGPWILDDYYSYSNGNWKSLSVDWSSDDDDAISACESKQENEDDDVYPGYFDVLGFDPYKEVIFLTTVGVAVAYHLDTTKVQFLGILNPSQHNHGVYDAFVYTPCHSLRPLADD